MSEVIKIIEGVDKLFSEIEINNVTYKTAKGLSPSTTKESTTKESTTSLTETVSSDPSNVSGVNLNSIYHAIEDTNARANVKTALLQIINEIIAREQADTQLQDNISAEAQTRDASDTQLQKKINAEAQTREASDTQLQNSIDTINSKIPSQATEDNQLADKDFVNSSIATNTANFIGTFTDINELKRQTATNNDYAYYQTVDSAGNTLFERWKYKASTSAWTYEYTLNNSSFTADEWASIQSGITENQVSSYDSHLNNTSNPHSVTKAQVGLGSVVNTGDSATPKSGGTTKFTTGGAYTELAKKNDKITITDDSSTALTDADTFSTTGNTGTNPTNLTKRPLSLLWTYIKGKADSVYAKLSHTHTKSQITDFPTSLPANGGTANTATRAFSVADYGNTAHAIKIGYAGPSATADNLTHIAGYLSGGALIKDVSKDTLKSWLDLGSAPYINTLDIAISSKVSVTMNTFTSSAINAPVATDGLVITHHLSSTRATQLALCGAQLFTRTYSNSTWSAWNAMWNTQES